MVIPQLSRYDVHRELGRKQGLAFKLECVKMVEGPNKEMREEL